MPTIELQLHDLAERHPGVSPGISASYSEAATVCLHRHHSPPVDLRLERTTPIAAAATWSEPDDLLRRAWANEVDATEAGAYCVALAALEVTDGLVAVARAETRTGADYYLGPAGQDASDLESTRRLEVSGIDVGGDSSVKTRLRQKMEQAAAGRSSLPAIATVVGFAARQVAIADVTIE
jgi:hypothetical protein